MGKIIKNGLTQQEWHGGAKKLGFVHGRIKELPLDDLYVTGSHKIYLYELDSQFNGGNCGL